jgi:hypothetical protein
MKRHLKDNNGDMYIQMLICTTIMLLISVIIISCASAINTKLWLDEQLGDIVKIVENTGCVKSPEIENISKAITDKLGGDIYFVGDFLDVGDGTVQLNNKVELHYHCDNYEVISLLAFPISTEINLVKTATSNVYFKVDNPQID